MAESHARKPSDLTRSISALFEPDGTLAIRIGVEEVAVDEVAGTTALGVGEVMPAPVAEPKAVELIEPEPVVVVEPEPVGVVESEPVGVVEPEPVGVVEPEVAEVAQVAEPEAVEVVEAVEEEDWGAMLEAVAEPAMKAVTEPEVEEDWESVLEVMTEPEAVEVHGPEPDEALEPEEEAVTEPEGSTPELQRGIAELRQAVDDFLSSGSLEREELAVSVKLAAAPLTKAGALNALAEAVERLAGEAGDPPDAAAIATARSLVSPAVGSRMAARLGTERDDERRAWLTQAAVRVGPDMALAFSDALSGTTDRFARHAFVDAMVEMGDVAMPVIEETVEDPRWFVVRNAVSVLGKAGGERAVELIVSTLAHPDGRVRREAILALAKVGGRDAGLLAYGMLQDPDPEVRLAATMAAGKLKVDRSLKPLLSLLEEETDHDVVVGVLGALGKLGDPGAVPSIEKKTMGTMLSRQPTHVRIAAYRALGAIRTPHAKSLLVRAADDKDPDVKAAVRELLGMR